MRCLGKVANDDSQNTPVAHPAVMSSCWLGVVAQGAHLLREVLLLLLLLPHERQRAIKVMKATTASTDVRYAMGRTHPGLR